MFVADVLHPVDNLPVELFLNGDVCHGGGQRRPMPVLLAGREPDYILGCMGMSLYGTRPMPRHYAERKEFFHVRLLLTSCPARAKIVPNLALISPEPRSQFAYTSISLSFSSCHLEAGHFLQAFWIPGPFHPDFRRGGIDVPQVFWRQLDRHRSDVLFQTA